MNRSHVMVVEDDADLREALVETLKMAGYQVSAAGDGHQAMEMMAEAPAGLVVSDIKMERMNGHALLKQLKTQYSDTFVLLMTAFGTIEQAVQAMQDGAIDYLVKPFEAEVLVNTVSRYLPQEVAGCSDVVYADQKMQQMLDIADRVADTDATVLITGESGTGKEVIARYLHAHSNRADQAFVAINCAAIPDNMLEATLFGYEKGAFTGAYSSSPGKFEQAQRGTILLDEISEMSLNLQAKLLRVLQEREVERLGGKKIIELDVRVLATSNRNLKEEVQSGKFREDLFYRLNVFPLQLPPLRVRADDIVPLAEHFIRTRAQKAAARLPRLPRLSESARTRLLSHPWPGNVRELDNLIQRALILQAGDLIDAEDLHFEADKSVSWAELPQQAEAENHAAGTQVVSSDLPVDSGHGLNNNLKNKEEQLIIDALKRFNGRRKEAAEKLGISQRTLRYKLARMRESGVDLSTLSGSLN